MDMIGKAQSHRVVSSSAGKILAHPAGRADVWRADGYGSGLAADPPAGCALVRPGAPQSCDYGAAALAAPKHRIRRGVVCLPKGAWRKASLNGQTSNALSPDTLGTAGGACFNDARVEVTAL